MLAASTPRVLFFSVCLALAAFAGQLPSSKELSVEDQRNFTQELGHVRDLLGSANDRASVKFQIARTYAAGGQYREAMHWLKDVIDSNVGFDPSRDRSFVNLRNAKEFQSLVEEARTQTPPVSNSRLIAIVPETDLFPENLAYDPATKAFFFGSTFRNEIVRCNQWAACEPFVAPDREGLGYVLGLKIHQPSRTLWVTSNKESGASLRHYRLTSGQLIRDYPLSGAHLFNDLVVSSSGQVFVTDTKEGAVYKLTSERDRLERLAPSHVFTAANGIALSPDETTLFVASFGEGVSAIDPVVF